MQDLIFILYCTDERVKFRNYSSVATPKSAYRVSNLKPKKSHPCLLPIWYNLTFVKLCALWYFKNTNSDNSPAHGQNLKT